MYIEDGANASSNCFDPRHEVETGPYSAPSSPRNVRFDTSLSTGGSLVLRWDYPEDFGGYQSVDGFKVYIDGVEPLGGQEIIDNFHLQTQLEPKRMYTFYVAAIAMGQEGPRSPGVQGWTTDVTVPVTNDETDPIQKNEGQYQC